MNFSITASVPHNRPPVQSAEERTANLDSALGARRERAHLKNNLKRGQVSIAYLIIPELPFYDTARRMTVLELLVSLPGVSNTGAAHIMTRFGIAPRLRVSQLGVNQRAALLVEFTNLDCETALMIARGDVA